MYACTGFLGRMCQCQTTVLSRADQRGFAYTWTKGPEIVCVACPAILAALLMHEDMPLPRAKFNVPQQLQRVSIAKAAVQPLTNVRAPVLRSTLMLMLWL
jgi:hypothetical protein